MVFPPLPILLHPDLTLDNIRHKADTLIYKPSMRLKSNTVYGISFNVTFSDGIKRSNTLAVTWKTLSGVKILSTNNRENGYFRKFSVFGDSLVVTFSKKIDTSLSAPVRFKVNIKDVKNRPVRSSVKWNSTVTRAVIRFLDTLPAADFDASPAYTAGAKNTRAVDSVTFDLTTTDGEQHSQLGLENDKIEIHTESGLCPINSSILMAMIP